MDMQLSGINHLTQLFQLIMVLAIANTKLKVLFNIRTLELSRSGQGPKLHSDKLPSFSQLRKRLVSRSCDPNAIIHNVYRFVREHVGPILFVVINRAIGTNGLDKVKVRCPTRRDYLLCTHGLSHLDSNMSSTTRTTKDDNGHIIKTVRARVSCPRQALQ